MSASSAKPNELSLLEVKQLAEWLKPGLLGAPSPELVCSPSHELLFIMVRPDGRLAKLPEA